MPGREDGTKTSKGDGIDLSIDLMKFREVGQAPLKVNLATHLMLNAFIA